MTIANATARWAATIVCLALSMPMACGQVSTTASSRQRSASAAASGVAIAFRTAAPAALAQAPAPIAGAPTQDALRPSEEVKSALGQVPPLEGETGRLAPIPMDNVRSPIGATNISVEDIGTRVLPEDQAAKQAAAMMPLPGGYDRALQGLTYRWQAANICHLPLYFEEPMLERHGQQRCPPCIQPAVSGGKFLGNLLLYPYKATLHPAFENRYTLGHFRPGSGAPALRDTLPWSREAALVQAGAATAVVVGLPW